MRHFPLRSAACFIGVSLLAAVGCRAPSPATEPAARQWYRANVATEEGQEFPFFLELPANCNTDTATIANGDERIPVPCQRFGGHLLLDFPVYGMRISAEAAKGGDLEGRWERTGGARRKERLRFGANPLAALDARRRFASGPANEGATGPPRDVSGIWRMQLDAYGLAKGVFEQEAPGVVRGTIEVPSDYGDLRFLAGNLHGGKLRVSTFDGGHAYALRGRLEADGSMEGEFVSSDGVRDTFSAKRSEDFDAVDPLQQVRVTSRAKRLDFAPLRGPRYEGKAVILEIFGSWCPNCNDLAPLLTALYREHHQGGLEMLGVAYEVSDDEAYTRDRLTAYRAKHGVDWEVMLAANPLDELFAAGPARLSPIEGVPLTIFLNRDRTIHAIYAGFRGPATGAAHQETTATFRRLTKEILESPRADRRGG